MMDCSCVFVPVGAGEIASYHDVSTPTARIPHVCGECGGPINPGDRYELSVGNWGGEWSRFKTCPVCLELRGAFFCEGYYYGMVWEDLLLHLRELDGTVPDCIADLSPAAQEKICDAIEEIWKEEF